ncbi:antirestriction protein ArdC [Mucilaginibacter frigoritolerans]|uniref:Antirestriction protein ArdC n=1 Tax=Mucilaginibacter frigoritolerans TaxID=652788 RepID=A0A562TT79_9SPHI|nr:zincin-like metallopeptidase domain-containing protein [Mucilaginibacter frigoritolerans]TWI96829.1 antirestriction protein ArdC [Mucilaginibacter frigoritolerans]
MNTQNQHLDVFAIITNRIIEQLEKQVIPWRKPWIEGGHPQNLFNKRPYSGINTWLLGSLGYAQNYFLTFKQLKAVGASVKKGEKGTMVVFWKKLPPEQTSEDTEQQSAKTVLRYYYVFNIAQIDHLPEVVNIPYPVHPISQIGACEEIIEVMPHCPVITHGKQAAFYDPLKDRINMPKQGSFDSVASYYGTLFHELIHSTGHQSRLNRKEIVEPSKYGSEPYSIEELTAEIGACYLNSVAGIIHDEFDNSVAYIKGWIDKLRSDKRIIVYASGQAQRATDYILNVQLNAKESIEEAETAETQ